MNIIDAIASKLKNESPNCPECRAPLREIFVGRKEKGVITNRLVQWDRDRRFYRQLFEARLLVEIRCVRCGAILDMEKMKKFMKLINRTMSFREIIHHFGGICQFFTQQ